MPRALRCAALLLAWLGLPAAGSEPAAGGPTPSLPAVPGDFPRFVVPGFEAETRALDDLHALHHDAAFVPCTLWDAWLPRATLWAAEKKRSQYRAALLAKRIDAEGYVSMQQHRGMAHSDGWPFPAWQQSTGKGFHFSTAGEAWAVQSFGLTAAATSAGWEITGAEARGIDPQSGLRLAVTADSATITTPPFRCGTIVAPFARIEWQGTGLPATARAGIEWLVEGDEGWPAGRIEPLPAPAAMAYANVPLHRRPDYAGLLTRYRLRLDRAAGAEIGLKSIITAIDTRHPVTNALYIRGCCDYVAWTGDLDFLRRSRARLHAALAYAVREFRVREGGHAFVPWVGHDGRSGIAVAADGRRSLRPGHGVGNNYWDLLPFGAHDALATLYLYDAVRGLADLERLVSRHPEWALPDDATAVAGLDDLAARLRAEFQTRFWNTDTGRFNGWIDVDGRAYDYGFTFLNLEAVAAGIAGASQAQSVFEWIDGRRTVPGDTSQGADIYHWRFAPRATTLRNDRTYVWAWSRPDTIPWGDQVQDGGAVLGFSYHDLMARLATNGPDDAWRRLREIIAWFREVQTEGGYRAYYARPGRGKLQGGGTAGGLGLDREFMESVLVPQVMLYGFLGFTPSADGYEVKPRLPREWPSLTISGIRFHDAVLTVTAHRDGRVDVERAPTAAPGAAP